MADVVIYTTAFCPYCHRAKSLLKSKSVDFTEIDVTMNSSKRREMTSLSGSTSVPQIFVDGAHLGDCDAIHRFDHQGTLDQKLGLSA